MKAWIKRIFGITALEQGAAHIGEVITTSFASAKADAVRIEQKAAADLRQLRLDMNTKLVDLQEFADHDYTVLKSKIETLEDKLAAHLGITSDGGKSE